MNAGFLSVLSDAILVAHLGVVVFNIFGLVAIPLGGWFGWDFVRVFWWRALHLAALAVVALQAVLGRACFLTIWQESLLAASGGQAVREPLIRHWINGVLYWSLPAWVFLAAYLAVCAYAAALWFAVPPRRARGRTAPHG